ncbi:AbrB/MazE/SpoVT family DNA-binding domain-containing protein [Thermus sediminis]|uniref:AbrB/MazE/SpoVT family DNA-binding domain-containing protein n=1 Tax=Thermus sediminis TaxID=1761908 RepID=UPI000E3EA5E5|nr:AbrB/MazE/SpoVT family DNA-binding domain-containing protein [Thermus sediminis]
MGHLTFQAQYLTHLGAKGRIVLPAEVRKVLGLKEGDRLLLRVREDGAIELLSAREVARRAKGMFAHVAPGQSLADELLTERREEAGQEGE